MATRKWANRTKKPKKRIRPFKGMAGVMAGSCYDHKWIFIHNPRTAGSSIRRRLPEFEDFGNLGAAKDRKTSYPKSILGHFSVNQVEEFGFDLANRRIFMVMRNPWDRAASMYRYYTRKMKMGGSTSRARFVGKERTLLRAGMEEWLLGSKDIWSTQTCQSWWGTNLAGEFVVDELLRFEDIVNEWARFSADKPAFNSDLGHTNSTKYEGTYHQYFTDVAKDHITRFFAEDIERGGYVF
jgi:hypothetical protein